MNQTHPMELVRDFMRTYQQLIPKSPIMPNPVTQNLRYRLIDEEAQELAEATNTKEYLDAIGTSSTSFTEPRLPLDSHRIKLMLRSARFTAAICPKSGPTMKSTPSPLTADPRELGTTAT